MKKIFSILVLLLAIRAVAAAQDMPRADLFAGYSYLNVDTNGLSSRQSMNGWESSASVSVWKWLAAEGDVSGYYENDVLGLGVNARDYGYVAGPRFNFRPAFVHVLLGVDRLTGSYAGDSASQNSFATAFGGGVQIPIGHHWAVRTSADYVLTHHNIFGGPGVDQNNFRLGVGIVYVFGGGDRSRAKFAPSPNPPHPAQSAMNRPVDPPVVKKPQPVDAASAAMTSSSRPVQTPPAAAPEAAVNALASPQNVASAVLAPKPAAPLNPQATAPETGNLQPGGGSAQPSAVPAPAATPVTIPQVMVEFWSNPTGADVEVDGQYVGNTFSMIALPPGQHTVTIRKQDFATWQRTVVLTSGNVRVAAYLERVHATVTFH